MPSPEDCRYSDLDSIGELRKTGMRPFLDSASLTMSTNPLSKSCSVFRCQVFFWYLITGRIVYCG
jgi:hypothetical protein